MAKGEYDRAIADYANAIRLDPKNEQAFMGRGTAYYYKRDYDRAIADYSKAIELNPEFTNLTVRGMKEVVAKGVSFGHGYGIVFYNRGNAFGAKGDNYRALVDITDAIELDREPFPAYYETRALIFLKIGDLNKAIADYDSALKLNPKLPMSLYGRGIAKNKKNKKSGDVDIIAAKAIRADIASVFARYGVK